VTGPDGLCIEFKEHWNTYISDIIIEFRRRYPKCKKDEDIKLINRGRILLIDNTIDESDIKCGDNLIVRIDQHSDDVKIVEIPSNIRPTQNEAQNIENSFVLEVKDLTTTLVSEMMKGYGKQQENINDTLVEMRRGWESALKSLAATQQQIQQQQQQQPVYVPIQQAVVSEKFDDQVYKALESSVMNKLTTQIEEKEKERQLQKPVHIGDIESDTDDDPTKSKAYEAILEKISPAISSMKSEIKQLKTIVETVTKKSERNDDVVSFSSAKVNEQIVTETEAFSPLSPEKSIEIDKVMKFEDIETVQQIEVSEKSKEIDDDKKEVVLESAEQDEATLLNASLESEQIDADSTLETAPHSALQIQDMSDGEIFNSSMIGDNKADESTVMQLESAENSVLMNESNITVDKEEEIDVSVLVDNEESKKPDNDDNNQDTNEKDHAVHNLDSAKIDEEDMDQEVEVSIVFTIELNKDLEKLSLSNHEIEIYPVPTDLSKDELVLEIRRYVAEEAQISLSRISLVLNGKTIMHGMDVDESFTAVNVSRLAKSGELTLSIKSIDQPIAPKPSLAAPTTAPISSASTKVTPPVIMSHSELEKIVSEVKKQDSRIAHDDVIADHFNSTRTSLDNTLNSLSETEGLTDDELAEKLSDLRRLKQPIAPHIDEHHGSISGVLGNLSNISAAENISTEKPDYLRLSLSNINRRSYDDDSLELPKFVDEPTSITNNKSSSEIITAKSKVRSTVIESTESLAGAKRLDAVLRDDHDIASNIQKSNNIFNRESIDGYSTQFDSLTSSNLYGAHDADAQARASLNSWDSSNISGVDLDKTIDSVASGPTDVRRSAVLRKADEYERKASTEHTPVKDYKSASKASTPSIASPFDNLTRSDFKSTGKTIMEDFDGNDSLALSDDSK